MKVEEQTRRKFLEDFRAIANDCLQTVKNKENRKTEGLKEAETFLE